MGSWGKSAICIVDKLLIPEQTGRADSWTATDEAEIGTYHALNPWVKLVGTIHTHPGFTTRPSSVDLHQQFEIQCEQPAAIGIIVAPERNESPSYTITPFGMTELRECTRKDFHPHRSFRSLYTFAAHVFFDSNLAVTVVDQR